MVIKPSPLTTAAACSSPITTPKKRQRSSSIDSSGDEVPKHQRKKDKPRHHTGSNICRVDEGALHRLNRVLPQLLKDLRVLHNFKEVNGRNVEDPKNFPDSWITVIHKGRGSEGVMKMLGEANQALFHILKTISIHVRVLLGGSLLFCTPPFAGP